MSDKHPAQWRCRICKHRFDFEPQSTWRVAGDEDEDLKRFIRGKYWTRIETKLQANYLREIGMPWAADEYDKLAE